MRFKTTVVLVLWIVAIATLTVAQTSSVPTSDVRALSLASQALLALNHGLSISDVTLTGTATYTAGSDTKTGAATLKALGRSYSRVDLSLGAPVRSEVRSVSSHMGALIDASGVSHRPPLHNCLTDAVWFFPAFTSLSAGSNIVFSYVGQETKNGVPVWHLHSYVSAQTPYDEATMKHLTAMDFYLDSGSLLPVAIAFNLHPDNNSTTDVPVEIRFSDYQLVSGFTVPLRIQKYLQNNLLLDFQISQVAVNTGLSSSTF